MFQATHREDVYRKICSNKALGWNKYKKEKIPQVHKKSDAKVLDWATSTETEGFGKKKKVNEAIQALEDSFLVWMKPQTVMCFVLVLCSVLHVPAVLAVVKGAVLELSDKILMHSPPSRMKKTTEYILDTLSFVISLTDRPSGWIAD